MYWPMPKEHLELVSRYFETFAGKKSPLSIVNSVTMYTAQVTLKSQLANLYNHLEPVAKSAWGNLSLLQQKQHVTAP